MLFGTPQENELDIFNGVENIEDLLIPYAKRTMLGRIAETALLWNILGLQTSSFELSEVIKKRWLIQEEVNPRQWAFYAAGRKGLPFLDLTLMNACYSYLNYLATGKNSPLWAIPVGSYQYLPSIGRDSELIHFLKGPNRLYAFYLKKDGAGLDISSLMRFKRVDFGFAGDVWHQTGDLWGGRLGLELTFNLLKDGAFQAQTETGFKTAGYLPKHDFDAEKYIQSGFKFDY